MHLCLLASQFCAAYVPQSVSLKRETQLGLLWTNDLAAFHSDQWDHTVLDFVNYF